MEGWMDRNNWVFMSCLIFQLLLRQLLTINLDGWMDTLLAKEATADPNNWVFMSYLIFQLLFRQLLIINLNSFIHLSCRLIKGCYLSGNVRESYIYQAKLKDISNINIGTGICDRTVQTQILHAWGLDNSFSLQSSYIACEVSHSCCTDLHPFQQCFNHI